MDPKTTKDTIINGNGNGQWLDDVDIPGSGGKKGFALRKVYADGRVALTYYEYGKDEPVKTAETTDENQQKRWDEFQKAQTPSATSQASAGRDTVNANGRVMQWNPETKRYDIDVGSAGTSAAASGPAQERSAQQNVERKRNSEKYGIPFDDIELQEWLDAKRKESDAKDEKAKSEARQTRLDIEAKAQRDFQNSLATRESARQDTELGLRQQAANRLQDPETKQWLEKQPDGTWKPITVEGQAKPGQGPSLQDLNLRYGNIVGGLTEQAARLQDALGKGLITKADYEKQFQDAKDIATVKINEINSIINTQKGYYSEQAAIWRQQQATANTRMNAASQALSLGVNAADRAVGASGRGKAGIVQGIIEMGRSAGERYGAYANDKPPELPAAAQRILSIDYDPDSGSFTFKPPAGAPGGGQKSVAQSPEMPASIQSMDDAVRADVTAAHPSDWTPAPGHSFSGGQLRAGPVPMSAVISSLPPDILDGFDPDVLSEALGDPEIGALYGLG